MPTRAGGRADNRSLDDRQAENFFSREHGTREGHKKVKDEDGEDFPDDYFDIEFGLSGWEDETDETRLRFNKPFFIRRIRKTFADFGVTQTNWKDADLITHVETHLPGALRAAILQVAVEAAFYAAGNAKNEKGFRADSVAQLSGLAAHTIKRRLGPVKRRTKPRTWTPELVTEARKLLAELRARVWQGRKFCTRNKQCTGESAAHEDRKHYRKRPKMPNEVIAQLPRTRSSKRPVDIAYEWVAIELNRRHSGLFVTAEAVKKKIDRATKATTNADTPLSQSASIA